MSSPPGLTADANQELYGTTNHPSEFHQTGLGLGIFQFSTPSVAAGFIDSPRSVFARCPSVTGTSAGSFGVPFPAQVSLPEITTKLIARVQALG